MNVAILKKAGQELYSGNSMMRYIICQSYLTIILHDYGQLQLVWCHVK